MKRHYVRIEGDTPILQNRFTDEAEIESEKKTRRTNKDYGTRREQAERACYKDKQGRCVHPAQSIARMTREAGSPHKQKGQRKSLKWIVPAALRMITEFIPILTREGKPYMDFEIDSRSAVNPFTKGRIMRHRPRFDEWSSEFEILINEDVLCPDIIHQLMVEGGQQIGIGDFRPEKGGVFGVFRVTHWEERITP